MKYLCILLLISHAEPLKINYGFFPNLPVGDYNMFLRGIQFCSSNRNTDIQANFFLNKRSRNVTELRGNLTFKVPFDDTLSFQANYAVKDSIGGWKDNEYNYKAPNACSILKFFLGKDWPRIVKDFGLKTSNCPYQPGSYVLSGYDLTNLTSNYNIPKKMFYGMFKGRVSILNKNNVALGCVILIFEVKRPWEYE